MRFWRDVGEAMTGAMRQQRRADLGAIFYSINDPRLQDRFKAWLWWGWSMTPEGHSTGVSGMTWPYWTEPKGIR